ncbi:MAG: hypothetical protein P8P98_07595, partial [Emcibacteraceae bacterium]|nr:hypothetical protein [Emcibacteraceae bacterium]
MKNIEMLKDNSHDYSLVNKKKAPIGFCAKRILNRIQNAEHGRIEITLPNAQTVCHVGSYHGHTVAIHFKTWNSIAQYVLNGQLA